MDLRLQRGGGFTLVELLVVVTIIVILLSLLAPAMSQAVYQAQLLQCMTNRRLLATSSHAYAMDNKRSYPDRDLPTQPNVYLGIQAHKLTHVYDTQSGVGSFDLRPMLRPYVSINKVFNDVFVDPADFDKDDATGGSKETTHLYTSTFYWAGWQYTGSRGGTGLKKLGGHFTFRASTPEGLQERRYTLLAGDMDTREGSAYASHPDHMYLQPLKVQDAPFPFGGMVTASDWRRGANSDSMAPAAPHRDPLDLNFAYEDGSVNGLRRVLYASDERTALIPNFNFTSGDMPGLNQVPRQ